MFKLPTHPEPRRIHFTQSKLADCFVLQLAISHDHRGHFVKTVQRSLLEANGLDAEFKECFYTTSHKNVLRGLHFQLPPNDQAKLVYCTAGAIYDVALDLRVGSPTFGQHEVYELSSDAANAVYLPRGIAHGFYVRTGPAVMVYHVTSEHDSNLDTGIHWNSFGAPWPAEHPIISQRDERLTPFCEFKSPFTYEQNLRPNAASGKHHHENHHDKRFGPSYS